MAETKKGTATLDAPTVETSEVDEQQAVWDQYHDIYPLHRRWIKDGIDEAGHEAGHNEWRVLVVRYRKQLPTGLGDYVYAGGPVKDLHYLNLARIQARMHAYLGELVWLAPQHVDRITFEPVPEKNKADDGKGEELLYEQYAAQRQDEWS